MGQEQSEPKTSHTNWPHSLPVKNAAELILANYKAWLIESWFALGNLLLLIGGDDSVELGIKPRPIQLLSQPPMPLDGKVNEGHRI